MRLLTSFPISSIGIDAHQTGKGNRVKAVYMNSSFFDFLSVEKEISLSTLLRKTYFAELKKNGEERKVTSKLTNSE